MSEFRLKEGSWIIVADGEKALFLKNDGNAMKPSFSVVREMRDAAPKAEITDKPGRMQDGPSPHRSAVAEVDPQKIAKERFAAEVADRLFRIVHAGDTSEIVIVAPPMVLGEMRKSLHKEVAERVVAEIPKTLTGHPIADIQKVLLAA